MKEVAIIVGNISKIGGTERATVNLANILINLNCFVTIISITSNESENSYYLLNCNVKRVSLKLPEIESGLKKKLLWYYSFVKILKNLFKTHTFDIAIGTGHGINSLLPFAKTNKNLKLIACEHIAFDTIPISSSILRRILYPYLDCVVVLTREAEKKFKYLKDVRRIPNSLPFIPEQISDLNAKQILAVGRLSKVKGFDRLIKLAVSLKLKHRDWKIKIVGEGEQEEQLRKSCKDLGVEETVIFAPFTSNIEHEYLGSSIYALTSYSEAFPMVLLEAKACGLPIVSFNCPEGPIDIINNEIDGFLVKDGDLNEFSDKISLLIEDTDLRKKMGINAIQDSQNYKTEKVLVLWEKLIQEI